MQAQLLEKQKHLKSLISELNMEQAMADQTKDDVARLQQELVEMKRLYLDAKKKAMRRKGQVPQPEDLDEAKSCCSDRMQLLQGSKDKVATSRSAGAGHVGGGQNEAVCIIEDITNFPAV